MSVTPYVLIATPCHRGEVHVDYCRAISSLCVLLNEKGIRNEWLPILEESLITRARNAYVAYMLSKEFTHLLFIDSDIVFDPTSIIELLIKDEHVSGCAYPRKRMDPNTIISTTLDFINWDILKTALETREGSEVKTLVKNGLLQEDMINKISCKSLSYVLGSETDSKVDSDGWVKVTEIGCGVMMIKRETILALIKNHPDLKYKNDCAQYDVMHENMKDNFYLFFDTRCVDGRYLSEDFAFCRLARDAGFDIWIYSKAGVNHIGTYAYKGNLFLSMS
jgi:hypothetical protein